MSNGVARRGPRPLAQGVGGPYLRGIGSVPGGADRKPTAEPSAMSVITLVEKCAPTTAPTARRGAKKKLGAPSAENRPYRGATKRKPAAQATRPRRNDELPQGSGGSDEAIALANQHHRRRHRQRCHDELVHVVGSRGRPWLDLSPSNWSGPICWSSRTWHKGVAGLRPAPFERPESDEMYTSHHFLEPVRSMHHSPLS